MKMIVNTKTKKQILENLTKSIVFVNKQRKGKVQVKLLSQFLKEL